MSPTHDQHMVDGLAVRCVVTGVDAGGRSAVLSDGPLTPVEPVALSGRVLAPIWEEGRDPLVPLRSAAGAQVAVEDFRVLPTGAVRFLMLRFPPGTADAEPSAIHQTDTIDCIMVMSGRVTLVLDGGDDVDLAAGDCVVLGGNLHAWRNTSPEPCVIAAVMVSARREE